MMRAIVPAFMGASIGCGLIEKVALAVAFGLAAVACTILAEKEGR